MPAKLQPDAAPKAKAKAKAKEKAYIAKVQQDSEVAFNEVKNDCDYPRDES